MGWASEAFQNELARCGIYPVQNYTEDYLPPYRDTEPIEEKPKEVPQKELSVEEILENEILEYMDNSYTEERVQQDETFNDVQVYLTKYGQGDHIATFNAVIEKILTIKYIRLFKNRRTGEYSLSFPSIKCGDRYMNCVSVGSRELYNKILQECIDLIK